MRTLRELTGHRQLIAEQYHLVASPASFSYYVGHRWRVRRRETRYVLLLLLVFHLL